MQMMITPDSRIVASTNQLSTFLDDEAVVLELESGTYFGLTQVSARIWELVQQPTTYAQVVETLFAEYDVARTALDADVAVFMRELLENQLIEIL
jgi:hypothetical protein